MAFRHNHQGSKRKLDCTDELEESTTLKRLNDVDKLFDPSASQSSPQNELPPITYASPDYRPPPRQDALWLQPIHAPTAPTVMEEDSTDEDDAPVLLTPLGSQGNQLKPILEQGWHGIIHQQQWQ
ncbi:hypothetical protein EC973_003133 [Apophysomyces ossiformis]|uniref:Uncharacterized protein n=1 Tax=Apophysomyces ossiformis TaxID=679940 RepID=A0A8H7BMS3_9FUNG|nr:hypothetical protein EC973_003133 [Apophysomyces ossiformis]